MARLSQILRQVVRFRSTGTYVAAVLLGALTGVTLAQDRMPGHLDSDCVARCVQTGQDSESCNKLCWVPEIPTRVRPDEVTDAVCLRTCLENGGRYSDCKPRCKLPIAK